MLTPTIDLDSIDIPGEEMREVSRIPWRILRDGRTGFWVDWNDPEARPQSGLEFADIVFEAWGAGPTRFATIFQSQDAPKVGPIRSARTCRRRRASAVNPASMCGRRESIAARISSGGWMLPACMTSASPSTRTIA